MPISRNAMLGRRGRWPILFLALTGLFAAGLGGAAPARAATCFLMYYWNADGSPTWQSQAIAGVTCGTEVAVTRSSTTTEIVTTDVNGILRYFWNADGSSTWQFGQIGQASFEGGYPPAITRFPGGTGIAFRSGNQLQYLWNIDGSPTWNLSTVSTFAGQGYPAITRFPGGTAITGIDGIGRLNYYYNFDGSPTWHDSLISNSTDAGWDAVPPTSAITRFPGGTEIVWDYHGALEFAYNYDGTPNWYISPVGNTPTGSFSFYNPAITRISGGTAIANTPSDNSLWYYWNADGSPVWNGSQIDGSYTSAFLAGNPAITRFPGGTGVAVMGNGSGLRYYWNLDGSPVWHYSQVSGPSTPERSPAMVRYNGGTEIVDVIAG